MVTKFDVFEFMYTTGGVLAPKEITAAFKKAEPVYKLIHRLLQELTAMKFVAKSEFGYEIIHNKKSGVLYRMISYCLTNKINYNELLDENIAEFISRGFLKKRCTLSDFSITPKTYSKYVKILAKNGLFIIVSRKPLTGLIPYNAFLRDLMLFFEKEAFVAKASDDEYYEEISRELKKFHRLEKRNFPAYQRIIEEFEIRFIHHSLSLEGNPITLPQTIKILKDHIMPSNATIESVEEVKNYENAMKQMMSDAASKRPLSKTTILSYHSLALAHRPKIAGKIRSLPVHIKGNPAFTVSKVNEIEPELDVLMKKYNRFMQNKSPLREILTFSSFFHNEFQHIHPFEEGNSRITRLVTFHLLLTQNIPLFDIPLGLLESYVGVSKGATKRADEKFNQILQLIILYNLKTINEKLS